MPIRRKRHRTPKSAEFDDELVKLQTAILKTAIVRFHAFKAKFGREPHEEEPLFFDASYDQPVWAGPCEIRRQIIEAARLTGSDDRLLLRFFGLEKPGPILHLKPR